MKSLLVVFVFCLYLNTSGAQVPDSVAKTDSSIRALLALQTGAWNRGSLDSFMTGYWKSDSLMFIGKSGVTYGWQNTLDNYKKGYPDRTAMGELIFTIIFIKPLSSEFAQVTGKWQLRRTIGDLSGHFTLLFRRIEGVWVIISDHSS